MTDAADQPYTCISLTDVEDSAPKFGMTERQEARFATEDLGASGTGVSHHQIHPGMRQAFGHHHDKAEEVYVVIAGSGRVKLDDDIVELQRLDAVRVAPAVMRAFEAGPDGLEVVAFGPRHKGDGDIVPNWWAD